MLLGPGQVGGAEVKENGQVSRGDRDRDRDTDIRRSPRQQGETVDDHCRSGENS